MSFAVDSNLWIYGFDNQSPHYEKARQFLGKMLDTDDQWVITWSIIYEVLRVLTHPALVKNVVDSADISTRFLGFIEKNGLRLLPETEDHRNFLEMVVKDVGIVRGNFWHDCHIAATLLEHGTNVLYTCDGDFRKIRLLKTINPFTDMV
jgi:predicted nucleic acid-binding protein